jgi:hypothetical protein
MALATGAALPPSCGAALAGEADMVLTALWDALRHNLLMAGLGLGIVAVLVVTAVVSARQGLQTIRAYRAMTATSPASVPPSAAQLRQLQLSQDDLTYLPRDRQLVPSEPEAARVAASLARVQAQYAPYNQAMLDYARARGEVPDDIVDARNLLSGRDDDWRGPAATTTGGGRLPDGSR